MKFQNYTNNKPNLKKIIFLVLSFSMLTVSCLKKQNLDEEDLGPAIKGEDLTKAMGTAHGVFDFNLIQPNEMNSYIIRQSVQDGQTSPVEEQNLTLISFDNTKAKLLLNVIASKTLYSGGQSSFESPKDWLISWPPDNNEKTNSNIDTKSNIDSNTKLQLMEAINTKPFFLFDKYLLFAFGLCNEANNLPITCHKLNVQNIDYNVPFKAYAQHNCEQTASKCTVPASKIEIDILEKENLDKNGKPRRSHITFILSKELPFLSRVIQYCTRGLYDINNGQTILVEECYKLNNYSFGSTKTASP